MPKYIADRTRYQDNTAANFNRIVQLFAEGIDLTTTGLRTRLTGAIQLSELSSGLQALLNPTSLKDYFTGTGSLSVFTLTKTPIADSEEVFVSGLLQKNVTDYSISGTTLTFVSDPAGSAPIIVHYKTVNPIELFKLVSGTLTHKNLLETETDGTYLYVYGENTGTADQEVVKYQVSDFTQVGSAVDVNSGSPDHSMMVQLGGFLWAIGAAAGTNIISKITTAAMTGADITVTVDTAATITSLATDGTSVFAFVQGGALAPNTIAKMNVAGTVTGTIVTGLTTSGTVDMAISSANYLYVKFSNNNQVRKYDTTSGALLQSFTFTDPIRIIPVGTAIYVLEGSTKKLHSISAADVSTELTTFVFTPTDIEYDGSDLWVSSGAVLRKVETNGTIIRDITPETGLTIKDIRSGLGTIFVSFTNDTGSTVNVTRLFPGLSGV